MAAAAASASFTAQEVEEEVASLMELPQWGDTAKRGEFVREVAMKTRGQFPAELHSAVMGRLWENVDDRGWTRKALDFTGRAVEEVVKSVPATGGAAVFGLMDAAGVSDSGSGTRLKEGVKTLVDAAGQRLKQVMPGESEQAVRDGKLELLREDIAAGAVPEEFDDWLAGKYDGGDLPEGMKPMVEALTFGYGRQAVKADHGKEDKEKLRAWVETDRNPVRKDSDIPGQPGPREYLADYAATKDPASWAAFKAMVTETDAQHEARLRKWAAGRESERTLEGMPEGLGKEMAGRAMDMQGSPIDLASAVLPVLRGAKALQAARAAGMMAAGGRVATGMLKEGVQEGTTAALEDPRATAGQIAEAAGMGAVGSGVLETGMAGVGAGLRAVRPGVPVPVAPVDTNVRTPGLEEDTGGLTAGDVMDLDFEAGGGMAPGSSGPPKGGTTNTSRVRQPILGSGEFDRRAGMLRDDPLNAPVEPGRGNVLADYGVQRSPEARAASEAAELARQQQIARLRAAEQKAGSRMPLIPDSPLGGLDILDFVNDNPLYIPWKGSEDAAKAENDWRERWDIPMYYRKFLASSERGHNAADLADMAWKEGYIAEPTADALMEAVQSTIRGRTQFRVQFRQREKALNEEAAAVTRFEKAQAKAAGGSKSTSTDKTLLALEEVEAGDEMTIDGEKAVVRKIEYDEDGYLTNVVIEDGKRFGVLSLDPTTRAGVFVDEWKPKGREAAPAADDFVPGGVAAEGDVSGFSLEGVSAEELEQEKQRAKVRAELAARQQKGLKGDAGEYGTPDLLDSTAGDMALFNQAPTKAGGGGLTNLVVQRDLEAGFVSGEAMGALIDLAVLAVKAGLDLATWTGQMVQRFGEAVVQYLKGAWAAAMRTSEVGAVGDLRGTGLPGAAANVRMGRGRASAAGPAIGPGETAETRARFARPEAEQRMYETRADARVRAQAEGWLAGLTMGEAVAAFENGTLPEGMTGDARQQAAGLLIQRSTEALRNGTELQQMEARALGHRISQVWQGWLSQEAGRNLRQRAVVSAELVPYAPIMAAEGLLIDRAAAVVNGRFEGGAEGAAGKVSALAEQAAEDASERIERILATVMGPRLGPRATVREAVAQMLGGATQRAQLLAEVAQALMIKARSRVVTPERQTALAALAASLKRTLGASVRGDARPAPTAPLGEVLARAFVDQVAESGTFAEAWEAGRVRVFDMLFDMELDRAYHPARMRRADALARLQQLEAGSDVQRGGSAAERAELAQRIEDLTAEMEAAQDAAAAQTDQFEAQRDALMPNTPALAYAPGMAREAVRRGFEGAGYTAELSTGRDGAGRRTLNMRDALNDRPRAVAAVLRVWDAEAQAAGLSPAAWAQGRVLAEQALNETLDTWQAQVDAAEATRAEAQRERLLAEDSPALLRMLNVLRGKLTGGMSWGDLFSEMPAVQKERQREIYRRLMLHEGLRDLSQDERLALTNELDKAWQRERRKAFNRELKRAGVIGEKDAGDREKVEKALPRMLRMINLGMFNSAMFREAVAPEYGLRQITTAEALQLRTLAEDAWKLPEGVLRNRKLGELLTGIQKATGSSRAEMLNHFWVASVLSGLRTMFDTFMSSLNGFGTNLIQSGMLLGRGKGQAAVKAHLQWWRGLSVGVRESLAILGQGDYSYLKRFNEDLRRALEGEGTFRPLPLGESLWRTGNWWQKYGMAPVMMWTGRLMAAADHINNTATSQGAMAVARALHPELYQGAVEFTREERRDARVQALREITGGGEPRGLQQTATVSARTREILQGALTPETRAEGNFIGDQAAYQNDPTGVFGWMYGMMNAGLGLGERTVQSIADKMGTDGRAGAFARASLVFLAGAMRAFSGVKFARFAANFGNDLVSYIPATYLMSRGAQALGAIERTRSQNDLLLGKNIFGLAAASTVAAMFLGKDDDEEGWHLEGSWNGLTPEQKQQRRTAGLEALTFWRRGDKRVQRVSYKSWPTAGIFAAVGSAADERRFQPERFKQRNLAGHLVHASAAGALQVKDTNALQKLAELFGASASSTDPETAFMEKLMKLPSDFAGGFVPTAVKDLDALRDPKSYKPEGVLEELARNVPGLRQRVAGGRPTLNKLGEPVELDRLPWSRAYTNVASATAHRVLGNLLARGLDLPAASTQRHVIKDGARVPIKSLGADAEWRYAKAVGEGYRAWLNEDGLDLLAMPDKQAARVIEHRAEVIKRQAARAVFNRGG